LPTFPFSKAVAVCEMSPTFVEVTLVPALIRVRAGQYACSTCCNRS